MPDPYPKSVVLLWWKKGATPQIEDFITNEDLAPPSPNPDPHAYFDDALKHANIADIAGIDKEPWILITGADDVTEIVPPHLIKGIWWRSRAREV